MQKKWSPNHDSLLMAVLLQNVDDKMTLLPQAQHRNYRCHLTVDRLRNNGDTPGMEKAMYIICSQFLELFFLSSGIRLSLFYAFYRYPSEQFFHIYNKLHMILLMKPYMAPPVLMVCISCQTFYSPMASLCQEEHHHKYIP